MRFVTALLAALLFVTAASHIRAQENIRDIPELSSVLALFSAHASAEDGVRLNWTLDRQSPTIVSFRIYRGYAELGNFAVLSDLRVQAAADTVDYTFTDSTARRGVTYYYKLAALGQKSESVFPVVITATPPVLGQTDAARDTLPAIILPGDRIALYVRTAGHVKLQMTTSASKSLVDDDLQPGIYEFDSPAGASSVRLHLEHGAAYRQDYTWPMK
jgi:hypothetical protein